MKVFKIVVDKVVESKVDYKDVIRVRVQESKDNFSIATARKKIKKDRFVVIIVKLVALIVLFV